MSLVNQNVVIRETHYRCRGCSRTVMRHVDHSPGALVAKYVCSCIDSRGELVGPQFPLYKQEEV